MMVEVTKEVPVEVVKEVPVEVLKEVEVPVEVVREVEVQVPVEVIVEKENTERVDELEAMISVKDSEILVKQEEVVRGQQLLDAKESELATLADRLTSKDVELATLAADAKLAELRRQNEQLFDATSEAFNKGVADTAARFPALGLRPMVEASGLKAKLIECYESNKGQTLNCSKVVGEFRQSLDQVTMEYLSNRMPSFAS